MGLGWFGGGSCLGELCFSRKKWVCRGGLKNWGLELGRERAAGTLKGVLKVGGN